MYMCVWGIDHAPVSTMFRLRFGTFPTVQYYLFVTSGP